MMQGSAAIRYASRACGVPLRSATRRRPKTGDRHEQHDQGCRLASAAAPCGDKEHGPIWQERSLDQGQAAASKMHAGEVGGDVDRPFISEEVERAADCGTVALLARRQDGQL
jgi:hypothetical protein